MTMDPCWSVTDILSGHVLGVIVAPLYDMAAAKARAAEQFGRDPNDLALVQNCLLTDEAIAVAAEERVSKTPKKRRR